MYTGHVGEPRTRVSLSNSHLLYHFPPHFLEDTLHNFHINHFSARCWESKCATEITTFNVTMKYLQCSSLVSAFPANTATGKPDLYSWISMQQWSHSPPPSIVWMASRSKTFVECGHKQQAGLGYWYHTLWTEITLGFTGLVWFSNTLTATQAVMYFNHAYIHHRY